MFSWIPIYKEIAQKLIQYEDQEQELLKILNIIKDLGIPVISLKDKDKNDKEIPLESIDPFTFFASFNRGIKEKNRQQILSYLKEKWTLEADVPDDFAGIPIVNNMRSWFFGYKKERKKDDIKLLWELFKEVMLNKVNAETFNSVLNIKKVNINITMALYWIDPENYISLDSRNQLYLQSKGINTEFKDYNSYQGIIKEASEKFEDEFYQVSIDAWQMTQKRDEALASNEIPEREEKHIWICAPGRQAKYWDECVKNGYIVFGADQLPDLTKFKSREEIADVLRDIDNDNKSHKNDSLACWQFSRELKVGDIIIAKKGLDTYLGYGEVNGVYYYDEKRPSYRNIVPVKWIKTGEFKETKGSIVQKTLTDITRYTEYVDRLAELIGIKFDITKSIESELDNLPLNMILYGPPGTGKTYKIQNEYMPLFTTRRKIKTRDEFLKEEVEKLSWFSSIVLAMLDFDKVKVPEIVVHEVVKTKAALSSTKHVNATLWGILQAYSLKDCPFVNFTRRIEPAVFWKNEDSTWILKKELVEEMLPEIYELWHKLKNFTPEEKEEKRYEFITFHQSFGYEDFIEGIKPALQNAESDNIGYVIEDGIFKKMANRARLNSKKKFALFIDEINRGNIASIFGELITLLEEDKRESLPVILPYSKEEFTVPKNLYIIGTMNTADRSVEALDSALRRRFSFLEVKADSSVLNQSEYPVEGIDLERLLESINRRIEILLDKDHAIGHSYFMKIENKTNPLEELQEIFKRRIIPLLEEYFYGECQKIKMILGAEFVEEKLNSTVNFFPLDSGNGEGSIDDYYIYKMKIPKTLEGFIKVYETV